MVTRLKKWKPAVSFAAFALGVTLILSNVLSGFGLLINGNGWSGLRDVMQGDYQNTSEFRWRMSSYLEDFLTMATGGPVGDGIYAYESGYGTMVYAEDYETPWKWWGYHTNTSTTAASDTASTTTDGQNYKEQIAHMQEVYSRDRNILYEIRYEGVIKFSNTEGIRLDAEKGILPEGYNFLLHFDGEKVTAAKDGKEIDIYGDGYYRPESDWYVPGYRNFTVGKEAGKTEVTIIAAEKPLRYIVGNYAQGGAEQSDNSLYWLSEELKDRRERYVNIGVQLAIGILLFALYIYWHRDKQQADRVIARGTAHIWQGAKWFVTVTAVLIFFLSSGILRALYYIFDGWGMGLCEIATDILSPIYYNQFWLFIAFWCVYLLANDLRYTPKPSRKYLLGDLCVSMHRSMLKLPFQKRMVQRYRNLLLSELGLAVLAGVTCLVFWYWYQWYWDEWIILLLALVLLVLVGVGVWSLLVFAKHNRAAATDIGALCDQIVAIRNGNLTQPLQLPADTDLLEAAQSLNDIQKGMQEALEEQTKSERMKVELITNVSHDIKTPLTSIISYVELLNEEEGLPAHVRDYIRILNDKSQRLKTMVQDVFEVSKAAAGQLPVNLETLDLGKLLRQTLADMSERIADSPVAVKESIPEAPVMIVADGQRLYRVFQNLLQNALKYSLEGSRVFVTLYRDGRTAVASVKNTSKTEIAPGVDFTERFVRGDQSRTDGGSGLGLSIASNFTESCGGQFRVETIADLFVVTVQFPLSE